MVANQVSVTSAWFWSTIVGGIFSILTADYFNCIMGLPRTSQNASAVTNMSSVQPYPELCRVSFFYTIFGGTYPFWFNSPDSLLQQYILFQIPLWACLLLRISLCLNLLSETRMLNSYLYSNISGDVASKLSNACCPYEVPSLDLTVDKLIRNGNSLLIATTDRSMSVPSTGPAFQA